MISELAKEKLDFFVDAKMSLLFEGGEAFEGALQARREQQLAGYGLPADLPAGACYTLSKTASGTPFVELVPEDGEVKKDITVIYYHGGGFLLGLDMCHISLGARLVRDLGCRVLMPVYPCIPVATYKETFEAAMDAYRFALEAHAQDRVVLMGDSAGGNLAIAVCQLALGEGLRQPNLIIPYSPFVDMTGTTEDALGEYVQDDPLISWKGARNLARTWAPDCDLCAFPPDPFFGPKAGLAPMHILVGSREVLCAGVREFAHQVLAAGGDAELYVAEGLWHAFLLDQGQNIPEVEGPFNTVLAKIANC